MRTPRGSGRAVLPAHRPTATAKPLLLPVSPMPASTVLLVAFLCALDAAPRRSRPGRPGLSHRYRRFCRHCPPPVVRQPGGQEQHRWTWARHSSSRSCSHEHGCTDGSQPCQGRRTRRLAASGHWRRHQAAAAGADEPHGQQRGRSLGLSCWGLPVRLGGHHQRELRTFGRTGRWQQLGWAIWCTWPPLPYMELQPVAPC